MPRHGGLVATPPLGLGPAPPVVPGLRVAGARHALQWVRAWLMAQMQTLLVWVVIGEAGSAKGRNLIRSPGGGEHEGRDGEAGGHTDNNRQPKADAVGRRLGVIHLGRKDADCSDAEDEGTAVQDNGHVLDFLGPGVPAASEGDTAEASYAQQEGDDEQGAGSNVAGAAPLAREQHVWVGQGRVASGLRGPCGRGVLEAGGIEDRVVSALVQHRLPDQQVRADSRCALSVVGPEAGPDRLVALSISVPRNELHTQVVQPQRSICIPHPGRAHDCHQEEHEGYQAEGGGRHRGSGGERQDPV
mmetsp:Transcript_23014/g.63920  ORF Transcript_23014/g.63920 Transcript_23014/m.63920 type:complete len:301 (+) Transcript_23014:248-1150(+)